MRLNQFFKPSSYSSKLRTVVLDKDLLLIKNTCNKFLHETQGNPIVKEYPATQAFIKIKARMRRQDSTISQLFNEAFQPHGNNVYQRAMHGSSDLDQSHNYYLFIPDGYHFLYNQYKCESVTYKQSLLKISDTELATRLIQEQYQSNSLTTAIENQTDIMFFDIPHCYAIHKDSVDSYQALLLAILNTQET